MKNCMFVTNWWMLCHAMPCHVIFMIWHVMSCCHNKTDDSGAYYQMFQELLDKVVMLIVSTVFYTLPHVITSVTLKLSFSHKIPVSPCIYFVRYWWWYGSSQCERLEALDLCNHNDQYTRPDSSHRFHMGCPSHLYPAHKT